MALLFVQEVALAIGANDMYLTDSMQPEGCWTCGCMHAVLRCRIGDDDGTAAVLVNCKRLQCVRRSSGLGLLVSHHGFEALRGM